MSLRKAADFKKRCKAVGLVTQPQRAEAFSVGLSAMKKWEAAVRGIPLHAWRELERLEADLKQEAGDF